jgi:hypothetical protein
VALLLLGDVVVHPASAMPPKASAAVAFNMKFRLCIVFLRMVPGRNLGDVAGLPLSYITRKRKRRTPPSSEKPCTAGLCD